MEREEGMSHLNRGIEGWFGVMGREGALFGVFMLVLQVTCNKNKQTEMTVELTYQVQSRFHVRQSKHTKYHQHNTCVEQSSHCDDFRESSNNMSYRHRSSQVTH